MEQHTNATYATITNYHFPTSPYSEIRVTKKQNGTVWFAVEDICKATGIIPQHVFRNIDPAHRGSFITYKCKDGTRFEIDMVSFDRLRIVVADANTAQSKKFMQWVEVEIMGFEDDMDIDDQDSMDNEEPMYDEEEDIIDLVDTIAMDDCNVDMRSFNFENSTNHEIRTIVMEDGSVWFVAKDVCDVLDLANSRKSISTLDNDEKADVTISDTSSNGTVQRRLMKSVSESGLYALIFKSRKPEAKKFRKWVTSVVLPQIRQTGSYSPGRHGHDHPSAQIPAIDIPHIDPAPAPGMVLPEHIVSPRAATAFVQAATDIFWGIENALNDYKAMETSLKKARKDVSVIIRSAKQVFPTMSESIDILGGHDSASKLEVEMR